MKLSGFLFCSILAVNCYAQADSIDKRIVVIGDAGNLVGGRAPVIDAVRSIVPMTKNTVVLFVGDNLYTEGLPNEQAAYYTDARNVLDTQVALVRNTPAKAYFIPGNHDWANGKPGGLESVVRQQMYIDQISTSNIQFYPKYGCPGPVEISLGPNAVLILMDSQWWLNRTEKPGIESDCDCKTQDEVLNVLKDMIDRNSHKLVLFACHHPFKSTGPHSGYFGFKQYVFPFTDLNRYLFIPLPVIGSIYPISRSVFGSPQDLKYPAYVNMTTSIEDVLKTHPFVVHLHGHEHSLQLLNDSSYHYIISGGGCKTNRVNKNKKVEYSAASMGFAVVDVMKSKNVNVTFYEVPADTGAVKIGHSATILNFSKFPPVVEDSATIHEFIFKDSAVVAINEKYKKASAMKRWVLGDNYRQEWATPVAFKMFNIRKEMGGLKVVGLGGGRQNKELHLVDKNGRRWDLRAIKPDPRTLVPNNFRNSLANNVVQDLVSASNPYSALVVPTLSDALKLTHTNPRLFFVPDDYALGYYRPAFANTVCILEESDPTVDGKSAVSTERMLNRLIEDNDHSVNQQFLLKARLLDFLVGDFDRHEGHWKWSSLDTGARKTYYPIPKDRDEAFFYSDGLLFKWITLRLAPYVQGFSKKISKPRWMGYVARDFDRLYLNELDANHWKEVLVDFNRQINDSVINAAINKMPPQIAAMDKDEITEKLKARKDQLPAKAMRYYKYISKRVNVLGTNHDEYFHISRTDTGVNVSVFALGKSATSDLPLYSRTFDPHITKEVRLFGLNGNDLFRVDEDVSSKIYLTVVGGEGVDTFDMRGKIRNYLYDLSTGNNKVVASRRSRNMMSTDPEVNDYDIKGFNYDIWRFPQLHGGYNPEDKLLVGTALWWRAFGFRKEPYAADHNLAFLAAPAYQAYRLKYDGEFIDLLGKYDLVLNADLANPALNNFFGYGNETTKLPGADFDYYRVKYKYASADLLLRKRLFGNKLKVGIGPSFYYYWNHYSSNINQVLQHPAEVGLDSISIYQPKTYAGGLLSINVNNLNDDLFPTRGVNWTTELTAQKGVGGNSNAYTKLESNMTVYASLSDPAKVVAILRLGGGKILSSQYEFFQAMTLGSDNYLRGFRKDRFSGHSSLYGNIELRVKLCDVNSYLVPGTLGLVGFNDVGRVWQQGLSSDRWHDGYGGGLYFTPFNKVMISAVAALSDEEALFNFTIGSKINLTF
ncbi:MAG: BamA/TamA family outer membrane protein [Bacteroidetes bacterium]|nr:BamA/TamA family outer membrane protein [Bacteroidota bacterium]